MRHIASPPRIVIANVSVFITSVFRHQESSVYLSYIADNRAEVEVMLSLDVIADAVRMEVGDEIMMISSTKIMAKL